MEAGRIIKAVIFDLDGVLVFTDEFHYLAWKQIADEKEIYFDREINNRLRGVGRMDSLEIILEKYTGAPFSSEEKRDLAERKNNIYRELLKEMKPEDVSEDVRETLAELRKRGYKIALGSSSKNAKTILKYVNLTEAFDQISDGTIITKSKPDPEVFLKAAELLDEKPENCMVVEDAKAGIQAGISGGMKTAAIGAATACNLSDYKLEKLSDLLRILEDNLQE